MTRLGLNTQTLFGMPPVEHVTLAADLGCGHISTGLGPVPWKLQRFPDWSLRDNPALRREMLAAMKDRGITIALAEGCIVRPQADARDYAADLDLMAELGAQGAGTVSMEPDKARAIDQLSILAELTAERGMTLAFEFAPPHTFNTLETALAATKRVGAPNIGLLIDAMHLFRTGGSIEGLAAVDPDDIFYAQLCDAALVSDEQDYYRQASFERQCPGDGELPLRELLGVLARDIPIGLEVPMLAEVEASDDISVPIRRIVEASRRLLGES